MGRFKPSTSQERTFDWGLIKFAGPESIEAVLPDRSVIFHRFGDSRGSYARSWSKFRRKLKTHKDYTIYDVHRWAYELDIQHYTRGLSKGNDRKIQ